MNFKESPPKKRKRNIKKKDENQNDKVRSLFYSKSFLFKTNILNLSNKKTSTIINKPKRRAPTVTRKEAKSRKKTASQTTSSDIELPKEIINETSTPEKKVKTKNGRNFWSLEDDKKLADAVLMNLQDVPWSKIARENFPDRDRSGCYNRWNVIKKRLYQDIYGGGGEK